MERMIWERSKEARQILGRVDLDDGELPNGRVITTKILERSRETERACDRRGQCHRSQIVFAIRAAQTLLQIDVSYFVRRQLPLLDEVRP